MYREALIEIFNHVWPVLVLVSIIVLSLRTSYLIKYKKDFVFYKEMLSFTFILYVLCLFYIVTFQDVSWSSSNFIPFKEIFRYNFGTWSFFKNVIGNMLMFMPYGFFVAYILKLKKCKSIIGLSLVVSFAIETIQSCIGRVFDVDDIILNVLGAIIGFYIYKLIYRIKSNLPDFLKKDIIYNILMVIIIVCMLIYMLNMFGVVL